MIGTLDAKALDGLGDHYLTAVQWLSGGRDLVLVLQTPTGATVRVVAEHAAEVQMDLDFRGYFGMPFVFESSAQTTESGILFRLEFCGTPEGFLKLLCSSLVVSDG
jgi:hypothetical protein